MAKGKAGKTAEGGQTNGGLVFEEMDEDFAIPTRVRSGAYDDLLTKLADTDKVVAVYHSGPDAKGANVRRKSLVKSAETKGLWIHASVRSMTKPDGTKDNILFAQFKGKLKDKPVAEKE